MLIMPFDSQVPSPSPRIANSVGAVGGGDGGGGVGCGGDSGGGGGGVGGGLQAYTSHPTQSGSDALEVPRRQRV
jgi:hypothetical protein